jgi:hypothetical protein
MCQYLSMIGDKTSLSRSETACAAAYRKCCERNLGVDIRRGPPVLQVHPLETLPHLNVIRGRELPVLRASVGRCRCGAALFYFLLCESALHAIQLSPHLGKLQARSPYLRPVNVAVTARSTPDCLHQPLGWISTLWASYCAIPFKIVRQGLASWPYVAEIGRSSVRGEEQQTVEALKQRS